MERVITYTVDNPLPRQKVRGFLKLKHYSTHSLKRLRDQPEVFWSTENRFFSITCCGREM